MVDDDQMRSIVYIREYDEDRDIEAVEKLEKNCEMGSKNGLSIFTNMMADPLCRIKLYPLHVMLVAELVENGDLVGVVRGCIKSVGTCSRESYVMMGCILGLRVSPRHRRKGIGLKLVKSIEEWMMRNGAEYTFLATEETNIASTNLFTLNCKYASFSSLVIYVQPVLSTPPHGHNHNLKNKNIKMEKLNIDEAISLYKNKLRSKDLYPTDIGSILKENLSLGTWGCFFEDEDRIISCSRSRMPSSWVIFSIWNTCEAYKLDIRKPHFSSYKFFHATLSLARDKLFPCLKLPVFDSSFEREPFGFLFLYGLCGEGERVGELMKGVWSFASRMAENVKDCKVILTEIGASDPLREHVNQLGSSVSCINDLWYLKKMNGPVDGDDYLMASGPVGNVFVDPREF